MTIYYVYRITNIKTNMHYYGKRSCNIDPKFDLGFVYFSSSKNSDFISDQKNNKLNYKYKIIRIFNNNLDATNFEIKLHLKFDVKNNIQFYNMVNQTSTKFDTSNMVSTKDQYGNFLLVSCNDPRFLNGELVGVNKNIPRKSSHPFHGGKIQSESNKNRVNNGTHNFLSEESATNASIRLSKMWQNSNYRTMMAKITAEANKKRWANASLIQCPFCEVSSKSLGLMNRYHFDNCKNKPSKL